MLVPLHASRRCGIMASEEQQDRNKLAVEEDEIEPPKEHLLVEFSAGNVFAPDSIVTLTPEAPPVKAPAGYEFSARVVLFRPERQTLTLVSTTKERELVNILANDVLRPGTRIECGDVRATIQETDAEWHRDQKWARPCPKGFIGKKVRWNVEGKHGEAEEHEGTVWGWLPAEESDYYPDKPEEEGGEPGPLWRVKFRHDIESADLDQQEVDKAVDMYSRQQKVKGRERHSTAKRPAAQLSPDRALKRHQALVTESLTAVRSSDSQQKGQTGPGTLSAAQV